MLTWPAPAYDGLVRLVALVVVCLAGCNAVLDLRETELNPPDEDGDAVDDRLDNCPAVANPSQDDGDADGFGDACDFCPALATTLNHDEDGDLRGDECDVCPMVPDFQANQDGDGVGDACDFAFDTKNELLLFDPFVALGGSWEATGVPWRATGDTIVETEQPPSDDPGLANPAVVMTGKSGWQLRLGVTSTALWGAGDIFGVSFVDPATHALLGSCLLQCAPTCKVVLVAGATISTSTEIPPTPVTDLVFEYYPNFVRCTLGSPGAMGAALLPPVTPVIHGNPKVQLRYFAAWQ